MYVKLYYLCRSVAIRHVREMPVTRSRFWAFSLGLVTYRAQSDSKNAASQVSVTQNIQSEHGVFSLGPEAQSLDIRGALAVFRFSFYAFLPFFVFVF